MALRPRTTPQGQGALGGIAARPAGLSFFRVLFVEFFLSSAPVGRMIAWPWAALVVALITPSSGGAFS